MSALSETELQRILADPSLAPFIQEVQEGKVIFYEGDKSQDIYILLEGSLEVKKSGKIISMITKPGEIFGEMASLLDKKRSATIKAHTHSKILKIPHEDFQVMSQNLPWLHQSICQSLAHKMKRTTELNLSLSELCNLIPDSVIVANFEKKIIQTNQSALELVGGIYEQLMGTEVQDIFEDPSKCLQYMHMAEHEGTVRDQLLTITKNNITKYLSTTITCLKDPTGKISTYIFFLKDVTKHVRLEKRLKTISRFVFILILVCLPFITYTLYKQKELNLKPPDKILNSSNVIEKLKRDSKSLSGAISSAIIGNDIKILQKQVTDTFSQSGIYNRIIVIDKNKNVLFDYYKDQLSKKKIQKYPIGQLSEAGASFKVLRVYESDKDNSTNRIVLHIAYRIEKDKNVIGWIIFEPKELDIADGISEFN